MKNYIIHLGSMLFYEGGKATNKPVELLTREMAIKRLMEAQNYLKGRSDLIRNSYQARIRKVLTLRPTIRFANEEINHQFSLQQELDGQKSLFPNQ